MLELEDNGILTRPDAMLMAGLVTRLATTYCRVFRKLVTQMMIYDHAFGVLRVNDGRPATTSLIDDNDILRTCLCHCLTLRFFVDVGSFLYKAYRDQGWIETQCDEGTVDNNAST